ncbi:MAG: Ig-like domain-containing protein [Bacteroidaceae bacterium]|nr:Ig-like domain-containing protein [Bacteroidaceae bacterium]
MKTRGLVAVLLLLTGFQSALAQTLKLYLSDKQVVEYSVEKVDSLVFTDGAGDTAETHEWVDLGLPSGTLWATCNVGANSPEEYGDYFAWGEIEPKNEYSWSTYKYCKGSIDTMTKYCTNNSLGTVDNKTELEPSDDAATVNWGSGWQMPSEEQFEELINSSYTTTTWTTMNGVYGRKITSKSNGNSIFLPAAGYRKGTSLNNAGSSSNYWSRSLSTSNINRAYGLRFDSSDISTSTYYRYYGPSVRPVRTNSAQTTVQKIVFYMEGNQTIECNVSELDSIVFVDTEAEENDVHEYVDLGLPSGTLWATCNVGASSPEEYGDYFAWGETEPKTDYSWNTYKYCKSSSDSMTKYCTNSKYGTVDNKTELEPSDDAATVNWGSDWQMPSYEQCMELYNSSYTTTTWTTLNGVKGKKITSKSNGNSIFLPAANRRYGTNFQNASMGNYWSRSLWSSNATNALDLFFHSDGINFTSSSRDFGQSVRPVRVNGVVAVASITLNQTGLSIGLGKTSQISAIVLPENATNKKVVWASSNDSIATVDQTGNVTAVAGGTCTITCSATDGSGVKAGLKVTVIEYYEYVDLGLPSGTLWATCNLGASSPEECGYYFAWGETEPKTTYNWSTYKYCNGSETTMTKYCTSSIDGTVDNKTELEAMDDAATVNWGTDWQMPSKEQFDELINGSNTTTTWAIMNGVKGWKITSKSNGNSIFLPAAGYRDGTRRSDVNSPYYWTCSLFGGNYAFFHEDKFFIRYIGCNVRPVRVKRNKVIKVAEIILNGTKVQLRLKAVMQLKATVMPWYATKKNVRWGSSNKSIATVDETGKVTAVAAGTCTITCRATDGSGVKAVCTVTVTNSDISGTSDVHDYVDLGLPSGTLWATCNVGASKPEEWGDYFAWGETEPKNDYSWNTYKYCNGSETTMTKYCTSSSDGTVDNKTELEPSDDAATVNWGPDWQMPSIEQCEELCNSSYTTTTWTTQNGFYGINITSKSNGNSIFLPAAGCHYGTSLSSLGSVGYYWSLSLSTSDSDLAYSMGIGSNPIYSNGYSLRFDGRSVRPVRVKN